MVNNRISKICELVTFTKTAEIGADHGKISLELLKQGKVKEVFLTDISDKSLQKSRDNFKENNLLDSAKFLVGDGLTVFNESIGDYEGIIAGMGGKEIISILSNPNRIDKIDNFVLQPQKNVVQLREFLIENDFKILTDVMVKDMGKFYNVLKVTKGKDYLTKLELNFGRTNLIYKNNDFLEFLEKELKLFKDVVNKTDNSNKAQERINLIKEVYDVLKKENIIC